jgi:hypothetical protein
MTVEVKRLFPIRPIDLARRHDVSTGWLRLLDGELNPHRTGLGIRRYGPDADEKVARIIAARRAARGT